MVQRRKRINQNGLTSNQSAALVSATHCSPWYSLCMPLETYPDELEPEDHDVVIWRFMKLAKFRDLMTTGEIYFCRADLFPNDAREGLPPEDYLHVLGLHPFDVLDRQQLCHHLGSDAQFREGFYVSCWHLLREETCNMWKEHGEDGVAICSRYRLLKNALDSNGRSGIPRPCTLRLKTLNRMERASIYHHQTDEICGRTRSEGIPMDR